MPKASLGKTGNAPHKRQGHTQDGRFGSNPNAQAKGARPASDLRPKG